METSNRLKSFFTEYWKYLAVSTACNLNIFETIQKNVSEAGEIAVLLNLNPKYLTILLQALLSIGFLKKESGKYYLTEESFLLTESHPKSLKYACMNWSGEHLNAWQNLDYSLKTGKSAFTDLYGTSFFDYLNRHPEKLDKYHCAMFEYARDDYKELANVINFSKHKSIMDVGGGYGALISSIKAKHPSADCFLFDLATVINGCKAGNISKISGDFFMNIPAVADSIILSRILHDWNDNKASQILNNCYQALPHQGYLYVIENCADKIGTDISLLSLNMLVMCESSERTSAEYTELAQSSGFCFDKEVKLNDLQTILIYKKS